MSDAAQPPTRISRPEAFSKLLERGVTALMFRSDADGVIVPAHLRRNGQVVLNFSWRYNLADFTFDGEQASASLSFGGVPSRCVVPWSAVWGISDDPRTESYLWLNAAQAEARAALRRQFPDLDLEATVVHQRADGIALLTATDDVAWSPSNTSGPAAAAAATDVKRRPAWLRVVAEPPSEAPSRMGATSDGLPAETAPGPAGDDLPPDPPRPGLRRIK